MKKSLRKKNRGYTIIEMMVAISVFLVVVTSGMTVLLKANVVYKKSHDMRSILDNLSFIMEDMSRNLRTGSNYHCYSGSDSITSSNIDDPQSSPSGNNCWGVAFEPSGGNTSSADDQWVYYIQGGKIFKSTQSSYNLSNFLQLTPDEVVITSASGWTVAGAVPPSTGDTGQPLVTIRLKGTITYRGVATPFSLQTTVSQRLIDI